jgi:LAGLIDADG endonuclease
VNLDPWYVTGFAEGEGSFTYSRSGPRVALYFAIKLSGSDRSVLVAIQRFFGGIGTIYDVGPRAPTLRSGFTKAASYFRVCRKAELLRVVTHFDQYPPVGCKLASYRVWREMVKLKNGPSKISIAELPRLAELLSSISPRHSPWSSENLQGSGTGSRGPKPRHVSVGGTERANDPAPTSRRRDFGLED